MSGRFLNAHVVFELLIGFFTDAGNYSSNSIDTVDYLIVTVKTPICSKGVTVTPARDGLTREVTHDLKMTNSCYS